MIKKGINLLLLLLVCSFNCGMCQEICDNGIDDDGDGLIDLNDVTDCNCEVTEEYIANPSFENRSCNSTSGGGNSQLLCLDDWTKISGSPDQIHPGGYGGAGGAFTMPQPDGTAHIGYFSHGGNNETFGSCLLQPLLAGVTYKFEVTIQ